MRKTLFFLFSLLCATGIYAQSTINTLTPKEKKQGWVLLFNGVNLDGWTSVGKQAPPSTGWTVENGILTVNKKGEKRGGDIITKDQYADFDLCFDFRLTKGANSGVKYFFANYENGGWLGCEFQVLDDDNHPDAKLGRDGNRKTASLYDMIPAGKKRMNPVGEWNQGRVVAKGSKVTHYLNGKKIISFVRASDAYKKIWEQSKFKDSKPMFGSVEKGGILLQDHVDEVSFRNIKIRVL